MKNRRLGILLLCIVVFMCTCAFVLCRLIVPGLLPHPSGKPIPFFTEWYDHLDRGWVPSVNVTSDRADNFLFLDRARNTILLILANGSGSRGESVEPTLERVNIKLDDGREWHILAQENVLMVAKDSGQMVTYALPPGFANRMPPDVNWYAPSPKDHIGLLIACCHPEDAQILAVLSGLRPGSTQPSSPASTAPSAPSARLR